MHIIKKRKDITSTMKTYQMPNKWQYVTCIKVSFLNQNLQNESGRKLCYIYSKFVFTKWMIVLLVTETFYLLESGQVYSTAKYAIFFRNRDYCHFCHFISIFIKQLFHLCKNWVKPKTWGLNHWISHSRKWP